MLEATVNILQMKGTAGAGSPPPLSLFGPVVFPDSGRRVTASSTGLFLVVEGFATTSSALSVRLIVALTK